MNIEEYSKVAPQYYSEEVPPLLEKILGRVVAGFFLDCGCGDGSLLNALEKKKMLSHLNVSAVDLSETRIALIKKMHPNILAAVDNAEELKTISSESIDLLVSMQVVEHVNQDKMLSSIFRVMKHGGLAYITTVYKKWYGWYFYRNHGKWVIDPTHLREYMEDSELLGSVGTAGLKVLESKKMAAWFPLVDFFVKRLHIKSRKVFENKFLRVIRKVKVPIPGYYNWEIVMEKPLHDES
jgi:2-polyprenyl-3-methyl-5-hydroxy-6-metoxy-1,4-benzoquinol methylase